MVDDIPFANLGDAKDPFCVSAPAPDARIERWLRLGYTEYTGDRGDEVDQIIASRAAQTAKEQDHRAATILSLEENNRRLSVDLVAARQKIAALVDGDQSGSLAKVAELADQLKTANARITDLEARGEGGGTNGVVEQFEHALEQLELAKARITELEAGILEVGEGDAPTVIGALTADAVLNELRRIADLPQGYKKELLSLIAVIDGTNPAAGDD
jgi:hypothetical protein